MNEVITNLDKWAMEHELTLLGESKSWFYPRSIIRQYIDEGGKVWTFRISKNGRVNQWEYRTN